VITEIVLVSVAFRAKRKQNFLAESALQASAGGLRFALFLTPRLRDGEGGYCGCPMIKMLILWQLEFE
jgi:hypothetical protein